MEVMAYGGMPLDTQTTINLGTAWEEGGDPDEEYGYLFKKGKKLSYLVAREAFEMLSPPKPEKK